MYKTNANKCYENVKIGTSEKNVFFILRNMTLLIQEDQDL